MEKPAPAPPRPVPVPPKPVPVPVPVSATPGNLSRASLASYQEKYADRTQAMAMAYRSGDFTLKEIAEHFGVQSTTVKRAVEQYAG
jgi:DNA-directed RNA polymerase specialized sigma24 family protein